MTQSLIAVKSLSQLFYHWTNDDENNLIANAPDKYLKADIENTFRRFKKFSEDEISNFGGFSNALMSEFFLNLYDDTAQYVLEYACKKYATKYL